jgi:hypothetical protein
VFGAGLPALLRDWTVANIADDVPGVAAEWQHPSWNFRSMYAFLAHTQSYPLSTATVGDGTPLSLSLCGGCAAYVRFTIAAGSVGSVTWGTQSANVAMSLIRLR